MSAYSTGIDKNSGQRCWWENWTMASWDMWKSFDYIRPATEREAAIMDKCIWDKATADDKEELRRLLNPAR